MELTRALTLVALWAVAGALLWWGDLPPRLRRGLALLACAAGLVFLAMALNTAGQRWADTTTGVLMGTSAITDKAYASASLPYYVMTGLCLLLGTAGMALSESAARRLRRHWLAMAIGLSLAVPIVRLMLERSAAPPALAWAFGVTALAPLVGAYFAASARVEGKGWREVVRALAVYALSVRGWIAVLYVVATLAHLGSTHYDMSRVVRARNTLTGAVYVFQPGSASQLVALVAVPQLVGWPVYTVVAGLIGAGLVRMTGGALSRPSRSQAAAARVEMSPARPD
jgi:hypothetical protein